MRAKRHWARLRHSWLELLVFAVVLGSIIAIWHTVRQHDGAHARRLTTVAALGIQADFEADMRERIGSQRRLGHLWRISDSPSQQHWEATAKLYIDDYPGALVLEWVDANFKDRWLFPTQDMANDILHQAADERQRLLGLAVDLRQPVLGRRFTLTSGRGVVLAVAPVFSDSGNLRGFVVNTMDVQATLTTMLQDISRSDYNYVILQGSEVLYAPTEIVDSPPYVDVVDLSLTTVGWHLRVWPKPAAVNERSALAAILVAAIALLGLALLTAVRFAKIACDQRAIARSAVEEMRAEVAERRRMEQTARASEAKFAGILDISADAIVSIDDSQRIVLFNQGAEKLFGYRADEVLGNTLDLLLPPKFRAPHHDHVATFAGGETTTLRMCNRRPVSGRRKSGSEFAAEATVSKLVTNGQVTFTAIVRDITETVATKEALIRSRDELEQHVQQRTAELAAANATLQDLSGRLLTSQEEERRRIARELHDSTSSSLVLALIQFGRLQEASALPPEAAKDLLDGMRNIEQAINELRTVSYRLHPPMLEEFGLSFALKWYVNGFSERSGIHIDVTVDRDLGRLPHDVELTMFRIVQEALANVQRHAKTDEARVHVQRNAGTVCLEIADKGLGACEGSIETHTANGHHFGVGIAGMRERVRQLGGTFNFHSSNVGTTVVALFPIATDKTAVA